MENSQPKSNIVAVTIAKNESTEIAGWLDACRQFSCCQIVADTGSTDDTRELAERSGASVIDIPWADDFAAARNLALKAVAKHPTTKDCLWIAMLDADEHITSDSAEKLNHIIQEYTSRIDKESDTTPEAISITIINIDTDDKHIKNREIHRFTSVRIFRNIPQLRYEGNIHEQLYFIDSDNSGNTIKRNPRTVIHPEIKAIHTGYSSNRVREKTLRNLSLLQADITLHGEGPRHYRYLADCYHGFEDYAKSLRYAELAIASPLSAGSSDSDMYSLRLICMRKLEYPLAEQIASAIEATDRFPRLPDFAAILGELQLQAEDYASAKENLQKSLALYNDYQQVLAAGTIDNPEASSFAAEPPNVHYRLAKCQLGLGNILAAKQEILTALVQRPQTIEYLTLAEEIFKDDFFDAIIIPSLSKAKEEAALIPFYRDFAASRGALKLRQRICDLDGEYYKPDLDFDPLYKLLEEHRWAELLNVCEKHAQENHHILFLSALELAAREHNDEAKTAIAHLSVPAEKLISAIIAGNIGLITAEGQTAAIIETWVSLASTVACYASAEAAVQFAALAPIIPPEASETLTNVGMLFYETGRMEAAAHIFSQLPALPELPPKEQDEISLIGQIDLSSADIITYVSSIVSEEDYPELCRRLKGNINLFPSLAPVFIYFAGKANIPIDDDYTLLALGNYTTVAGRTAARLSQFTRLAIIAALRNGIPAAKTALSKIISSSLLQSWQRLEQGKMLPSLAGHPQEQALLRLLKESSTQQASNGQPLFTRPASSRYIAPNPAHRDNPLVSILIPTYNRPELFERTLLSALNQTYPNVEVIITDNSTDDKTANIVAEKFTDEPRLRYIRNASAKCKADNFRPMEQLMRGEYMHWCMDDDLLYPDKLSKMAPILRDNPKVKLVTSHRDFIDINDNLIEDWYRDDPTFDFTEEYRLYSGEFIGKDILTRLRNYLGEPSATLHRRNDLTHHYWSAESKGLLTISDVAMWLELLETGDCVIFRDALSAYRRHDGQEGVGIDTIILSRFEWEKLIEEYHRRKIFLTEEIYYRLGLSRLYKNVTASPFKDVAITSPHYGQAYIRFVHRLKRKLQ